MKHTPGPWKVFYQDDEYPGIEVADRDYSIVVYGDKGDFNAGVQGDTHEEALANAQRIVACVNACEGINPEAVPDMLKALEGAVEAMVAARDFTTSLISNKDAKWTTYVELTDAMRIPQINQLIAKARGEA